MRLKVSGLATPKRRDSESPACPPPVGRDGGPGNESAHAHKRTGDPKNAFLAKIQAKIALMCGECVYLAIFPKAPERTRKTDRENTK